jgi:hypothetical protein
LSSAPRDGGQINQATFRIDVQVLILALPQVFDTQIIQPHAAFDDSFDTFSFTLADFCGAFFKGKPQPT